MTAAVLHRLNQTQHVGHPGWGWALLHGGNIDRDAMSYRRVWMVDTYLLTGSPVGAARNSAPTFLINEAASTSLSLSGYCSPPLFLKMDRKWVLSESVLPQNHSVTTRATASAPIEPVWARGLGAGSSSQLFSGSFPMCKSADQRTQCQCQLLHLHRGARFLAVWCL